MYVETSTRGSSEWKKVTHIFDFGYAALCSTEGTKSHEKQECSTSLGMLCQVMYGCCNGAVMVQ